MLDVQSSYIFSAYTVTKYKLHLKEYITMGEILSIQDMQLP